jgi:hypothetical protein
VAVEIVGVVKVGLRGQDDDPVELPCFQRYGCWQGNFDPCLRDG